MNCSKQERSGNVGMLRQNGKYCFYIKVITGAGLTFKL